MKIPLQVSDDRITVTPTIMSRKYHFGIKALPFVVDTGSPLTLIMERDAVRLGLPINSLSISTHVKLGGALFELREIVQIHLNFRNEKDELIPIAYDKFYVARSTKRDAEALNSAYSIPSIIGVNFMKEQEFTLVFAPHKHTAFFER